MLVFFIIQKNNNNRIFYNTGTDFDLGEAENRSLGLKKGELIIDKIYPQIQTKSGLNDKKSLVPF